MFHYPLVFLRADDVGADIWNAAEGGRGDADDITPAMRQHVRRQTAASCALSEILSSVILLSFSIAEWTFRQPMIVFDVVKIENIDTEGKIGVIVYTVSGGARILMSWSAYNSNRFHYYTNADFSDRAGVCVNAITPHPGVEGTALAA